MSPVVNYIAEATAKLGEMSTVAAANHVLGTVEHQAFEFASEVVSPQLEQIEAHFAEDNFAAARAAIAGLFASGLIYGAQAERIRQEREGSA